MTRIKESLSKIAILGLAIVFFINSIIPVTFAQVLPRPELLSVQTGTPFTPTIIRGITVYPDNPMHLDFIVDQGVNRDHPKEVIMESQKLVKYFLACLTIPRKELWVNLSPFEQDRMTSEALGKTEMGRDLLAQDHLLKQFSAALMFPEKEIGKKFWDKVYAKISEQYGRTDFAVDTFHKVWIVPQRATVYTNKATALVVDNHLKVMLEEDYLAEKAAVEQTAGRRVASTSVQVINGTAKADMSIIRDVIVPELEKEVNSSESFANLRQIFNSMILAIWYKQKLQDSLLTTRYGDKGKLAGVDLKDPAQKEAIYQAYLKDFEKGIFDYIKEEKDQTTQELMPRHYFSGGVVAPPLVEDGPRFDAAALGSDPALLKVAVDFSQVGESRAWGRNPYFTRTMGAIDESKMPKIWKKRMKEFEKIVSGWRDVTLDGLTKPVPFAHARVNHNSILGDPRGGVRWVWGADLVGDGISNEGDEHFKIAWAIFNQTVHSEDEARKFIQKWMEDEAKPLSYTMTKKNAGNGLAHGGAKGDVFVGSLTFQDEQWVIGDFKDEKGMMLIERLLNMSRVARGHMRAMADGGIIGPGRGIMGPDMRVNAKTMAFYADEYIRWAFENGLIEEYAEGDGRDDQEAYKELQRQLSEIKFTDETDTPYLRTAFEFWKKNLVPVPWLGVVTGKPENLGGLPGRHRATGFGAALVAKLIKGNLARVRTMIHGFGNAGRYTAVRLAEFGADIFGISDMGITVYYPFSKDFLQQLAEYMDRTGVSWRNLWTKQEEREKARLANVILPDNRRAIVQLTGSGAMQTLGTEMIVIASRDGVLSRRYAQMLAPLLTPKTLALIVANGGMTALAQQIWTESKGEVTQDAFTNPAGVGGSVIETRQTNGREVYTGDRVQQMLDGMITATVTTVQRIADSNKISLGDAFERLVVTNLRKGLRAKKEVDASQVGGVNFDWDAFAMTVREEDNMPLMSSGTLTGWKNDWAGLVPVFGHIEPIAGISALVGGRI